jgi:hypothetical protein
MKMMKPSANYNYSLALALAILHCCTGTAAQHVVFDGGDEVVPTALQLLRGGVGVHDVLSTSTSTKAVEEHNDSTTKQTTKKVQTFNLKENITLTLSSAEVDKNFCDPSSPLSLAGYMNGEIDDSSKHFFT